MSVQIIHGDSRDALKMLADNSIDAVVTDPPYALVSITKRFGKPGSAPPTGNYPYMRASAGFIGQQWDTGETAFDPAFWVEVLRVLKPGGHCVAFGGTRSYHRLACAIEDAGFEIRDMCQWLYGCLDEEAEALTRDGWKHQADLSAEDEVLQWDSETRALSWVRPLEILRYPYDGPMVRLTNRHTDQLLTPNHRVHAKIRRHSRNPAPQQYEVIDAADLRPHWQISLPTAGVLADGAGPDPVFAYLVGWWLTDAWRHGDGKAVMFSQCKPEMLEKLRAALAPHCPSEYVKRPKKETHSAEHTFYVTGPIADRLISNFPNRVLSWDVLSWSEDARRALLEGLVDGDGSRQPDQYAHAFWSKDAARRAVFMALAATLGMRVLEGSEKGVVYFNIGTDTTQLQSKHRVPDEHYNGTVWCVRVPAGAFMCRRRGGVFITGNSGFPKSHNVSKGIDKSLGKERDKVRIPMGPTGNKYAKGLGDDRPWMQAAAKAGYHEAASDEAATWEGYGTALKPAVEPVCLARKPLSEKTVAANVLKWGTGALNIDATRIYAGTEHMRGQVKGSKGGVLNEIRGAVDFVATDSPLGRWPANVLHDGSDEVLAAFPDSGPASSAPRRNGEFKSVAKGTETAHVTGGHSDNGGSVARFFYSSKAGSDDRFGSRHPTVKPVDLMRWLCRLVTPPGGTVLDCFAGSGSTGAAAFAEGFDAILIEREAGYVADIRERMAWLEGHGRHSLTSKARAKRQTTGTLL